MKCVSVSPIPPSDSQGDNLRLRGGGNEHHNSHNNNKFSINRPEGSVSTKHKVLKHKITRELRTMYMSGSNINKKREYLLLLASCLLDWIRIHRGACTRSWSKKISDMFNSYVTNKRGDFKYDKRIIWSYSYSLIRQAISNDDIDILYKVSCVSKIDLNKQLVYVMVNLKHNKIYVGRTNNLLRRLSEHMRDAFAHIRDGSHTERVHAYMSHCNASDWSLIPVGAINNILADAKIAEAKFIKVLHRNRLLNDDFHTRARNKLLSKKSKSFKRANKIKTHRGATSTPSVCNYVPTQYLIHTKHKPNDDVYSHDFCRVMQHLNTLSGESLSQTRLSSSGAMTGLTNWKRVRLLYGTSTITYRYQGTRNFTSLSSALSKIKSGEISSFRVNSVVTAVDTLTQDTLQRIGASKRVAKRICCSASLHELLSWRGKVHVIKNQKLRSYSACSIEKYLKARFNLSYSKPLVVRVPFSPNISLNAMRSQAVRLIDSMDTEPSFARLLKRRVRVVFTKQPSIEDHVSNHKQFCKKYKHDHPPVCVCNHKPFRNLPRVKGHIAFKATDVNNPLIKTCLHVNAKNIITPTEHSVTRDVTTAFDKLISDLMKTHDGVFADDANLHDQVQESLDSFVIEVPNNLEQQQSCVPTMHDIAKFKKKYKGLVVCPLDKNTGCMFLCCPCYHDAHLRKTFTENASYSKSKNTPSVILDRWERFYDTHNYSRWYQHPRRVAGDDSPLPVSYILPKNKDIEKDRPITSYFKHPFKRVFNSTGRALLHLLEKTTDQHFNMSNVNDLMTKVEKLNSITQGDDTSRACLCLNGDLANMFTSLDHTSIREAVRWLLNSVGTSTRRRSVSVPTSKVAGGDVHLTSGQSGDADTKRITITFEDILEIVDFDLNNTYFRVGDRVLQQKVGIPMGSPLSPALAQIVCAYYEYHTLKRARRIGIGNQVEGVRYVDDLTAVIYYDPTSLPSKINAELLANMIQFGYHPKMELEVENTDLPFKFLSSILEVEKSTCKFEAKFHNKNLTQIKRRQPQLFPTYQHFHSYAPTRQKSSVVISSIHRIGNACNSVHSVQKAFNNLFVELRQLKYPTHIIRNALWRVQSTDPRWQNIDLLPGSVPSYWRSHHRLRRPRARVHPKSWPAKRGVSAESGRRGG